MGNWLRGSLSTLLSATDLTLCGADFEDVRSGIPWKQPYSAGLVNRTLSVACARAKVTLSPGFGPSAMEECRRRRGILREAITRGVAAVRSLLKYPNAVTIQFCLHLCAINSKDEELKSLNKCTHKTIDLDELEADLFASYDEQVIKVCTQFCFARPSAVPSLFAAHSTRALSHTFAVIREGQTMARPWLPTTLITHNNQ